MSYWLERPADSQLAITRSCLKTVSMLLSRYSKEPPDGVVPFKSQAKMEQWFKLMIDHVLPEDMRWKE